MNKIEKLVEILKKLNAGEKPEVVKKEAKELLASIDPKDLAIAEQKLIKEGLDPKDLRNLCSIHMEVIKDKLKKLKEELKPGHPIHTMISEHEMILGFLDKLEKINKSIQEMESYSKKEEFKKLIHIAEHLVEAEFHHQREEEVLFPELEKRGVFGPPQIMRMEHKELKIKKKELLELAKKVNKMNFSEFKKKLDKLTKFIVPTLQDHIFKENNILYPTALQVIKEDEIWNKMKLECDKIGYCCFTPES